MALGPENVEGPPDERAVCELRGAARDIDSTCALLLVRDEPDVLASVQSAVSPHEEAYRSSFAAV